MFDTIRAAQAEAFTANRDVITNVRRLEIRHCFNTNNGPVCILSINDVDVDSGSMEHLKNKMQNWG